MHGYLRMDIHAMHGCPGYPYKNIQTWISMHGRMGIHALISMHGYAGWGNKVLHTKGY